MDYLDFRGDQLFRYGQLDQHLIAKNLNDLNKTVLVFLKVSCSKVNKTLEAFER